MSCGKKIHRRLQNRCHNPRASLDLDVDSPDKVPDILRNAADDFYEAELELSAAWQDDSAGRPWRIIAQVLEEAVKKIDNRLYMYYYGAKKKR